MYSLNRRHEKTCRYRKQGRRHINCNCPIHLEGEDANGVRQRLSLKTRNWQQAQQRLVEFEQKDSGAARAAISDATSPALSTAIKSYLADCQSRNLEPSTITSYTKLLDYLAAFFPGKRVAEISLSALTRFRSQRTVKLRDGSTKPITGNTSTKELQSLRAFFHFCKARKWIAENPASELKPPKFDRVPTLPFSKPEVEKILAASISNGRASGPERSF